MVLFECQEKKGTMIIMLVSIIIICLIWLAMAAVSIKKINKRYKEKCKEYNRIYNDFYYKHMTYVKKKIEKASASIVIPSEIDHSIKNVYEIVIEDLSMKLFEEVKKYMSYSREYDPSRMECKYTAKIEVINENK